MHLTGLTDRVKPHHKVLTLRWEMNTMWHEKQENVLIFTELAHCYLQGDETMSSTITLNNREPEDDQ